MVVVVVVDDDYVVALVVVFCIPETFDQSLVTIRTGTAEILLTLSLCWWWWWCKVIFVSNPTFVMLG